MAIYSTGGVLYIACILECTSVHTFRNGYHIIIYYIHFSYWPSGQKFIKTMLTWSKRYFECERKNITLEVLNHSMYQHNNVPYTYTYMYAAERVH